MKYIERALDKYPRVIEVADVVLPTFVKALIRKLLLDEKYPLSEPLTITIGDIQAQFWIKNPSDWYRIGRGGFEKYFAEKLLSVVTSEDIFLDVGSAQGLYSIMAAMGGAEVYAVDPDPISINAIRENVALNFPFPERLHILGLALGDNETTIEFNVDPNGVQAGSIKKVNRDLSHKVSVQVTSIDTLIKAQIIKVPTIVKIDVEGAEHQVLLGMRELLMTSHKPTHLFVEFHERFLPYFGTNLQNVQMFIADAGYVPADNMYKQRDKQLQHFTLR